MSYAWQVTSEDIYDLLRANDPTVNGDQAWRNSLWNSAEQIFSLFDDDDFCRVEEAALYGDSMHEQTDYANETLLRIIEEKGFLVAN